VSQKLVPGTQAANRGAARRATQGLRRGAQANRIDIEHAFATFRSDREFVFGQVKATIGSSALNSFRKEIVRAALIRYAGIALDPAAAAKHVAQWYKVLESLLEWTCDPAMGVPQRIELRRAVAMMLQRVSLLGSAEHKRSKGLLQEVAEKALR
jgi:hypothetical protein